MANIVPNSFKSGLLKGTFNFDTSGNGGNAFKLALYTSIAGYTVASTVYSTSNEVSSSGTSYTAGGNTLTNNGVAGTTTAFVDFADLTFPSVTLTAAGAAIYKTTGGGNELVLVLDFGGNKTATNGDFIIQFPTPDASNAIIRLGDA
tara:strand:- start:797 stop:1237 length:441 start_codon:yes stop_codon:yes gene_type:complete